MSASVFTDGVLRQWWDDNTRTYHEYDANGVEITTGNLPRDYTPEENARADAEATEETIRVNEQILLDKARQELTVNSQAITQLTNFANGTGALTNTQRDSALRDLAQQQARAFRQLNALIKLEVNDLLNTEGT